MSLSTGFAARLEAAPPFHRFERPKLELTGGRRKTGWGWRVERRLLEPVSFRCSVAGFDLSVEVPAGYITDGYSMPGMLLQVFQPSDPIYLLPPILHDWPYDVGILPREVADLMLLQAMRAVGVPEWQCIAVYGAVRVGGGGGYGKPLPVNMDIVREARAKAALESAHGKS